MKTISIVISYALLRLTGAGNISEQCRTHEATTISCHCTGNEEFSMPEGYNYENVTSLRITSCSFANLHFSSFTEASRITEIIVQNISERLIFEPYLTSRTMKRLKLSRIRRIPLITRETFVNLRNIETLRIEDTRIGEFQERFSDLTITNLTMVNVTIERVEELNFSANGGTLRIKDSELQNVTGSLNFAYFSNIEIVRSKFQLQKPGYVLIEGDRVLVENCVFSNASANVVAAERIRINGTCADGKSSMRLSSSDIRSVNNRSPSEIVYTKNKRESERFYSLNNTVCIAGNCRCPKSAGKSTHLLNFPAEFALRLLLPFAILCEQRFLVHLSSFIVQSSRYILPLHASKL